MSKTYTHAEVMDLIHKCKESEREIWREKIKESNPPKVVEKKPLKHWSSDIENMIENIVDWKIRLGGVVNGPINVNVNFTYPDILDMIEKQKMFYLENPDEE